MIFDDCDTDTVHQKEGDTLGTHLDKLEEHVNSFVAGLLEVRDEGEGRGLLGEVLHAGLHCSLTGVHTPVIVLALVHSILEREAAHYLTVCFTKTAFPEYVVATGVQSTIL